MRLKEWRKSRGLTLGQMGALIAFALSDSRPVPVPTVQKYESGQSLAPADVVEAIRIATKGAVSPVDMHQTRLDWTHAQSGQKKFGAVPVSGHQAA